MEPMRSFRVLGVLGCLIGLSGCSQNFDQRDVNPPARPVAAKAANPHVVAAPQAPAKGMTPMSERAYGGGQGEAGGKSVSGTITIAPDLAGRIPQGAILFVMARERVQGGAPYAVHRTPVPAFPYSYSLSQADVLPMFGEGLQFGDIDEMYIIVRIDRDGQVGQPDPGDMEGATRTAVKPGQRGVDIVIDKAY